MKNNGVIPFLIVRILHRLTATVMGGTYRPGRPALQSYAQFTRAQMERIPVEELPAVRERMYRTARRTGRLLRMLLFVRTDAQARRVVYWLYRCIGIRLEGTCPGTVTVTRCYFSDFYTPEMCQIMSAMDRGIFSGLFGGGELTFISRITEGCPCCRAEFAKDETRLEK